MSFRLPNPHVPEEVRQAFQQAHNVLAGKEWVETYYVPYTGANSDVDLGAHDLDAADVTATGDLTVGGVAYIDTITSTTTLSVTNDIDMGGSYTVTNLTDPTSDSDAVTLSYLTEALASETGTTLTNNNAGAIVIGTPVYNDGTGVDKAKADASDTSIVLGLVGDTSIASAASGSVQFIGVLDATTAQWDAVTGESGGLAAGSVYYLDAGTAGRLTTTAPIDVGEYVTEIGEAVSATKMKLAIKRPIEL